MNFKILTFLIVCFVCGHLYVSGQNGAGKRSPSAKSVSLRSVGKYGGRYPDRILKISNVVLEDVRGYENDWAHLFQLYDPRENYRRGAKTENENPCCIQEFSIFADEQIGKPLIEEKDEWFNKRVNVYVDITDRGLTPLLNIGLVVRVELLNEKGKVKKILTAD